MIDIISVILAEYETIPFSLLEILFAKLIEPEKVGDRFLKYLFRKWILSRNYEKNAMNLPNRSFVAEKHT